MQPIHLFLFRPIESGRIVKGRPEGGGRLVDVRSRLFREGVQAGEQDDEGVEDPTGVDDPKAPVRQIRSCFSDLGMKVSV